MNEFNYTTAVTGEIVHIPISMLHHHPDNPRKDLGDLTELANSIRAKGVMQNLTVVPFRDQADVEQALLDGTHEAFFKEDEE